MPNKTMEIDLSAYDGPVYSGRSRGEALREKLALDHVDIDHNVRVHVTIPEDTYSVTSSFFLGLFGPSIVKAGSAGDFYAKFEISGKEAITERLASFVDRALQQKTLFGLSEK